MDPIQVGISGFGAVAVSGHVPALKKLSQVEVVAIADPVDARRQIAGQVFPEARLYSSTLALLNEEQELDVLVIASPPTFHYETIIAAANSAPQLIICEKPLLTPHISHEKFTFELKDTLLYSVDNYNFSPLSLSLRTGELVQHIGSLQYAHFVTHRPFHALGCQEWIPDWRLRAKYAGGGVLLDCGWHSLYMFRELIGVTDVHTKLMQLDYQQFEVEQEALCILGNENTLAVFDLSWSMRNRFNRLTLSGQDGLLHLHDTHYQLWRNGRKIIHEDFPESFSQPGYHPSWFYNMYQRVFGAYQRQEREFFDENLQKALWCLSILREWYSKV